ncbi:Hypothetical predicted protein, partial [Marmota monax]
MAAQRLGRAGGGAPLSPGLGAAGPALQQSTCGDPAGGLGRAGVGGGEEAGQNSFWADEEGL